MPRVSKVIQEILRLVWKVLRTFVWKWLKPRLGKIAVMAVTVFAIMGVLIALLFSACS
jgi:hypothetical protein